MKNKMTRFSFCERCFHNTVMVTFVILLASGFAMLYFNASGEQAGTRENISLMHKVVSIAFIAGPILILLMGVKKVWKENWRLLTSWGRADFVWFLKKPFSLLSKKVTLPNADKFNPGQKSWAMVAMGSSAILSATGVYIWIYNTALLGLFIHIGVALIMTVALGGHLFMAIINPATRPGFGSIVNGKVDAKWAEHHHPIWFYRKIRDMQASRTVYRKAKPVNSYIRKTAIQNIINNRSKQNKLNAKKAYANV